MKEILIITGAAGGIGLALCRAFGDDYEVIGLDLKPQGSAAARSIACNLTSDDSVRLAMDALHAHCEGRRIAGVIHLAAYFDFSGEDHPLYEQVTIEGTRRLLRGLQGLPVERFIYASTMLVHEAGVPGQKITQDTPLAPGWAYPQSKADAEAVIRQEHGEIPFAIARLAGVYDEAHAVPTLSHQIARIYEQEMKSHLYAGDPMAGQAFLHQNDMIALFRALLEKRGELPPEYEVLAGEDSVMGYQALQNRIGALIHGEREWYTMTLPAMLAKQGAWLEAQAEPIIPDAIDQGEKPFIRPFMIDLASDHYDLDIRRAREDLGWQPQHHIYDGLAALVSQLKADPASWYAQNGITPPDWIQAAEAKNTNAETIRTRHARSFSHQHKQFLWAHFLNLGLAGWLISSPAILGYTEDAMRWSDMLSGFVLFAFAFFSLSERCAAARWVCGAVGLWLLAAPLIFWSVSAAAYLNGTITGMLAMGFALLVRPMPGISPVAAQTGPTIPPGWQFNPSSWFQRLPIIILAFIGFFISRYLCAYQLGHIDSVWEPFFPGAPGDGKNGTEEIITSSVSEAWPVPDAGLGALTYALEILTGIMGSARRWRTMPWLVMLFGIMIVPLGIVSITFIIIQPIWLGTWCTLCLIAAAAMLIQIPYSLDELVATSVFLWRRKKQGRPLLRIFFTGDTDDGEWDAAEDDFRQPPSVIIKEMIGGGITVPWHLGLCLLIGLWLMFTRLTIGAEGDMAGTDHLVGSLALTVVVTALAESARAVRFVLIPLGLWLLAAPLLYTVSTLSVISSVVCGLLLIALSLPRGRIQNSYGEWDRLIV